MELPYIISETNDFYPLSVLFHNSGVGIEVSNNNPDGIVKMWKMEDRESGELVAAITLQIRDGVFTLGDLAVNQEYRSAGYGTIMQNVLFEESRKLGIKELWCCAKIPEYYTKIGWEIEDWATAPKVNVNCPKCDKFGTTCSPSVIRYKL